MRRALPATRPAALLAALLALAACAQEPPLETRLQPYVGQTEAQLVGALGVPNATYATEGTRFLQFQEASSTVYPGDPFWPGPFYGRRFGGPIYAPPLVVTRTCAITFAVQEGRVTGFTFRGNGCR
ncbi:hypothetical protein [Paracraurococcus ruber]|uniref:Lipoprotein n=1 Tax=Paracraurococcus ruber TaxID=77675 RepID=A0ABS1D8I0_9PROT|nr:hypothetical protein [Paracraurococcus ruber]MBK1662808.1 hypothetical protein [Paracraurococcus ruber]TDG16231.1 hypothetical protein E2C05_29465 [Paracraurococcus ruber]